MHENDVPIERRPLLARTYVAAGLLVALTALTHFWMTSLEFQLDDFEQIHDAADPGGPAVLLGQDTVEQRSERRRPTFVSYFRPVLHATFMLDVALFGADPAALHASSVAWHALAVVLLYLALLRLLGTRRRRLAMTASALFAIHPGKLSAVSWIAARGDVLMVVFLLGALLALERYRRRGGALACGAVFLLTAAAILSKEGGIVVPVLLVIIDFLVLRRRADVGRGRALLLEAPLLLMAPAYLGFRQWKFGEYANFYAGHTRVWSRDIVVRMFDDLGPTFERLASGHFHYDEGGLLIRLQGIFASVLFVGVAAWTARKPLRRIKLVALLALLYLVAVAPVLRFFLEASGFDASRLFYLPAVLVSVALAFPAQAIFSRLQPLRWAGIGYTCAVLLMFTAATVHHVTSQLEAAGLIARVRQDLEAITAHTGRRDVGYAILGIPTEIDRVPVYGTFLTFAFREPFTDDEILARTVIDLGVVIHGRELYGSDIPVQFLDWKSEPGGRDRGRLEPRTGLLPGPTGTARAVELAAQGGVIDPPVVARDVRALRIDFATPITEAASFAIRFIDGDGEAAIVPFELKPRGPIASLHVSVEDREAWVLRGPIDRVAITSTAGPPPRLAAIDFAAELPRIELIEPGARDYSVRGESPRVSFRDPHDHPWIRLRIFLDRELTMTLPREFFQRDGDVLSVPTGSSNGFLAGENHGDYWGNLTSGDGDLLGAFGVGRMPFSVRIEGLVDQHHAGAWAQAASPIVTAWLVR